jgi:hypothetical protein
MTLLLLDLPRQEQREWLVDGAAQMGAVDGEVL